MKKLLAALLAGVLAFGAYGCANVDEEDDDAPPADVDIHVDEH